MKATRISPAILILVATAASAMTAPDNMKLKDLEAGAVLVPLPQVSVKNDPQHPQFSFNFYFRNGAAIRDADALDGTIRGLNDPRITQDNTTCTIAIESAPLPVAPPPPMPIKGRPTPKPLGAPANYSPIPPLLILNDKLSLGDRDTTLDNGQVIRHQRARAPFAWRNPQTGSVTSGMLYCYKVGSNPFTTGDLRRALGGNIQLSEEQSQAIMGDRNLRQVIDEAGRSIHGGTYHGGNSIDDQYGPKTVQDHVVNETDHGDFDNNRPVVQNQGYPYQGQYQYPVH